MFGFSEKEKLQRASDQEVLHKLDKQGVLRLGRLTGLTDEQMIDVIRREGLPSMLPINQELLESMEAKPIPNNEALNLPRLGLDTESHQTIDILEAAIQASPAETSDLPSA
jgi:hypothetical protein